MNELLKKRIELYCAKFPESENPFHFLEGIASDEMIIERIDKALISNEPIDLEDPLLTDAFYSDYVID
jgi:hypothetical protein